MDIDIFSVHKENIDDAWPVIEPFIDMGLDYANGEYDSEDVYEMIQNGSVIPVIMAYENAVLAVVTLEISQKRKKKVLCQMTAGGASMEQWLDEFMDVATELAIEQGCDAIYVVGRPGWAKKLKRYGYEYQYTVLSKELH